MRVLCEAGAWHVFSTYEHGLYRGIPRFSYHLFNSLLEKKEVEIIFFSSYENTSYSSLKTFVRSQFGSVSTTSITKKEDLQEFAYVLFPLPSIYSTSYLHIFDNYIPVVVFIHDLMPIKLSKMGQKISQFNHCFRDNIRALKNISNPITVSDCTKKDYCNFLQIPEEEVAVIHPAADPNIFFPDKGKTSSFNFYKPNYFLTFSFVGYFKNIPFLLKTFMEFIKEKKIHDLALVLVGIVHQSMIEPYIEDPLFFRSVRFLGRVSDSQLRQLYSDALAFIYPSLYEGFGIPPLEAMACGTPVLSTQEASLPEVVGRAAFPLEIGNSSQWKQAFFRTYSDKEVRKIFIQKGFTQTKLFSWKKTADQLTHLMKNNKYGRSIK